MAKPLRELSVAELGKLFPIILSPHNPAWKELYQSEKALIENALGPASIVQIHHYGSTAVPGLYAKPTIDILLEVCKSIDTLRLIQIFSDLGYHNSTQPDNPPPHMMFMKGYTPNGFEGQAYHVHVRYSGDWDELYFRDYLILHPQAAKEYEQVKQELKKRYEYDREAYTEGKTAFIKKVTAMARTES